MNNTLQFRIDKPIAVERMVAGCTVLELGYIHPATEERGG